MATQRAPDTVSEGTLPKGEYQVGISRVHYKDYMETNFLLKQTNKQTTKDANLPKARLDLCLLCLINNSERNFRLQG